jgi:probable HAF family extracellular repeat protein
MIGLGDLQGGAFESSAYDVSWDGGVVVGYGKSALGTEAFRWTAGDGMVGLGDLSGGAFDSQAEGTSADGSVIVGRASTAIGYEAFIWNAAHGMRNLKDLLTNDCGLDLTGWTLNRATDVSADGRTIVGIGTRPGGNSDVWVATIPEPATATLVLFTFACGLRHRRALS